MSGIGDAKMFIEARCPVDGLLFFRYSKQCFGTFECYCRRCKKHYVVQLTTQTLMDKTQEGKK